MSHVGAPVLADEGAQITRGNQRTIRQGPTDEVPTRRGIRCCVLRVGTVVHYAAPLLLCLDDLAPGFHGNPRVGLRISSRVRAGPAHGDS